MRLWLLIVVAIILSFISLFIGAIDITVSDLLQGKADEVEIFLISRVPRLMAIILAGAGMSIAGLIMQSLSRKIRLADYGRNVRCSAIRDFVFRSCSFPMRRLCRRSFSVLRLRCSALCCSCKY